MAIFQLLLKLKSSAPVWGSSEAYYYSAADAATAMTEFESLMDLRKIFLHSDAKIVEGVVSDTAILRDSLISTHPPLTGSASPTTKLDPWSALMVRFNASTLRRGRKFLHGAIGLMFNSDDTYDATNALNGDVVAFLDRCSGANYRLRRLTGAGPTYAYVAFTGYAIQRKVERKVGRPFGLLVGRR